MCLLGGLVVWRVGFGQGVSGVGRCVYLVVVVAMFAVCVVR
jgi:hypothetical protein